MLVTMGRAPGIEWVGAGRLLHTPQSMLGAEETGSDPLVLLHVLWGHGDLQRLALLLFLLARGSLEGGPGPPCRVCCVCALSAGGISVPPSPVLAASTCDFETTAEGIFVEFSPDLLCSGRWQEQPRDSPAHPSA